MALPLHSEHGQLQAVQTWLVDFEEKVPLGQTHCASCRLRCCVAWQLVHVEELPAQVLQVGAQGTQVPSLAWNISLGQMQEEPCNMAYSWHEVQFCAAPPQVLQVLSQSMQVSPPQ